MPGGRHGDGGKAARPSPARAERRVTLRDLAILIAAIACGLGVHRLRLQVSKELGYVEISKSTEAYLSISTLVYFASLGVFLLACLQPRQPRNRLVRQPGFLSGLAIACSFAFAILHGASNWLWAAPRLRASMWPSLLFSTIVDTMSTHRVAPLIALSWIIGVLHGFRKVRSNYVETFGLAFGGLWVGSWLVILMFGGLIFSA